MSSEQLRRREGVRQPGPGRLQPDVSARRVRRRPRHHAGGAQPARRPLDCRQSRSVGPPPRSQLIAIARPARRPKLRMRRETRCRTPGAPLPRRGFGRSSCACRGNEGNSPKRSGSTRRGARPKTLPRGEPRAAAVDRSRGTARAWPAAQCRKAPGSRRPAAGCVANTGSASAHGAALTVSERGPQLSVVSRFPGRD